MSQFKRGQCCFLPWLMRAELFFNVQARPVLGGRPIRVVLWLGPHRVAPRV
jgi:hypothetical protein